MLPIRRPDLETRLLIALCLLGSAVAHAFGVFLYYSPKPTPEAVTLEFITAEPDTPEPGLGASPGPEVAASPPAGAAAPAGAEEARGWRARWRAREQRYEADAEAHAQNIALLDQSLDGARGPAGQTGDSHPLALCDGPALRPVSARAEREVSHWGGLVPTGLFRAAYMEGMTQVHRAGPRLGAMEFALPARLARVPLDEPENAVVEVGRVDARCLIGISYSEGVFPIVLRGLPARLASGGEVREALVDVHLNQDGTFTVEDRAGTLGVRRGAVYNHDAVGRKLRTFYSGASLLRGLTGP